MSKAYLLDTSAIFAFTDNEAGADLVEELLEKARRQQITLNISAMTAMEVYYVAAVTRRRPTMIRRRPTKTRRLSLTY